MKRSDWKIQTEHGRYYAGVWLTLYDGGSDQWLYVASHGLVFVFIEVIDLPAYCGSDADCQWCAEVAVVDLGCCSPEAMAESLRSCGPDECPDPTTPEGRLVIAEAMRDYGHKAPMWSDSAGNVVDPHDRPNENRAFTTLRAAARRAAEALFDDERREAELDTRVVNRIGQTARQYMQGDLWGRLREIKDDPNATEEQKLVLRMYQGAGRTLGGEEVPADLKEVNSG